ncbi:MAG: hypothetical protein Q8942_07740 [Bacillota bacterium]|nr:hypothetical protein [Bacillota bacterium]
MIRLISYKLGQFDRDMISWEPGTGKCGHWLNPLFIECGNIVNI